MEIKVLSTAHKVAMRILIKDVLDHQGLIPEFFWPEEMVGPELATAEAVGVFDQEELVGFVLYKDNSQAWEISLVASHPRHRRAGYMKALIQHLIVAKGQGKELWLEVHEKNVKAQNLYEKLGFTRSGQRPKYYRDGATAYLYTCP
jgi:ribosomal-protein-alanine N-acetyltransferase